MTLKAYTVLALTLLAIHLTFHTTCALPIPTSSSTSPDSSPVPDSASSPATLASSEAKDTLPFTSVQISKSSRSLHYFGHEDPNTPSFDQDSETTFPSGSMMNSRRTPRGGQRRHLAAGGRFTLYRQTTTTRVASKRRRMNPFLIHNVELSGSDGNHQDLVAAMGLSRRKEGRGTGKR